MQRLILLFFSGKARWARLGDYNINSKDDERTGASKTVEFEIIERFDHPGYKSPSWYHDLALYKLSGEVQLNEYIRPICLQTDHQFPNTFALATGWGRTDWGEFHHSYQKMFSIHVILFYPIG